MSEKKNQQQSDWRRDNHTQRQNTKAVQNPKQVTSTVVRKPSR